MDSPKLRRKGGLKFNQIVSLIRVKYNNVIDWFNNRKKNGFPLMRRGQQNL